MKKIGQIVAFVLVVAMTVNTTAYAAVPDQNEKYSQASENKNESFSSYDDPYLAELIEKMGITQEQVNALDEQIRDELAHHPQTRDMDPLSIAAAVVAIVGAAVSLMGNSFEAGQYAARRCEVELGLTKKFYRDNKLIIRAAMLPALGLGIWGGPFCAGFDDYFTG